MYKRVPTRTSHATQLAKLGVPMYSSLPWLVKFKSRRGKTVMLPRCTWAMMLGMNLLSIVLERRAK